MQLARSVKRTSLSAKGERRLFLIRLAQIERIEQAAQVLEPASRLLLCAEGPRLEAN